MEISGKQFIDGGRVAASEDFFFSRNPATGAELPYRFYPATDAEIRAAATAAATAAADYRTTMPEARASFLEAIADEIEMLDDLFIGTVLEETGLIEARVRGERQRTINQLRMFAHVVRRGDFLGCRIDRAIPERQPLPRPDIRQYRVPLGPVAVFGASNFPLAFSVAGGDTASALAAGCPVIVKAHSSHPATSELVAEAVVAAVARSGMPPGVFGMLFGDRAGAPLVTTPEIKAVGFTGSRRGGRALAEMAARRPEPIPVFAEMSGVNPLFLLGGALTERCTAIAEGVAGSVTLGGGQFCTKPGVIIGCAGEAFEAFCSRLADEMTKRHSAVLLSRAILENYQECIACLERIPGIERIAGGPSSSGRAQVLVFRASANLLFHPDQPLEEEVFGPCTVVVAVSDVNELLAAAARLRGHLAAGIFAAAADGETTRALAEILETRVGRIIFNDYPTGVEVCDAIVHGGPWPSTSDSRASSVGSVAIDRFLRPVCYQGYPLEFLPAPLQEGNPLRVPRLMNGEWQR